MPGWDEFITDRDKLVFPRSGHGARMGFGKRPALLVVDITYGFCGEESEPILDALDTWHLSAGAEAWRAVEQTQRLVTACRERRVPIIYSTYENEPPGGAFGLGRWKDKNPKLIEKVPARAVEIVEPIAPEPTDIVLVKAKPSVFFGTPLTSYLIDLQVDTLLVCGTTTSGCVRASVYDGFSYNYRMIVVEECTFDRGEASHWVSLFDMDQKYADVVKVDAVLKYVARLNDDRFAEILTPSVASQSV